MCRVPDVRITVYELPGGIVSDTAGTTLTVYDGDRGFTGPAGPQGPAGDTGPQGPPGPDPAPETDPVALAALADHDAAADPHGDRAYGEADATAKTDAAQAAAVASSAQRASNLADLADAAAARTSLGLGDAAVATADTFDPAGAADAAQAAAIAASAQRASNLADLASAGTARTNLGLGTAAITAAAAYDAAGAAGAAQTAATTAAAADATAKVAAETAARVAADALLETQAHASGTYVSALNPAKYGAKFDGVTDDTAAWQACINEIIAGNIPNPLPARPAIVCPIGTTIISAPLTGIPDGLVIRGQSRRLSQIKYTGTGTLFNLNTFTTTPSNYFTSAGAFSVGFELRNIAVMTPTPGGGNFANEGSRIPTCIQDNGNGSIRLEEVHIRGFKYAFASPYGSDFDHFANCEFFFNDVGVYFGPGAEQVGIQQCQFYGNREGLVLDGCPQGSVFNCQFIDSIVADVVVEKITGGTRFGLALAPAYYYAMSWTFQDCWFESNADTTASPPRISPRHIYCNSSDAVYPQYLRVKNAHLVSGGAQSASNAFWEVTNGTRFTLEDMLVVGSQIKYVVKLGTVWGCRFLMRNVRQEDGFTGMVLWSGGSTANCTYEESITQRGRLTQASGDPIYRGSVYTDGIGQDRFLVRANGTIEWASGAAATDLSLKRVAAHILGTGASDVFVTGKNATASRPTPANAGVGGQFFDTTLNIPIWSDGTNWKNAAGTIV